MKIKAKKETAKKIFLDTSLTQKEIAERVGVTENTLSKWIREGEWRELKAARRATKDEIIKHTFNQINKIYEEADKDARLLTAKETDQVLKLTKTIDSLKTKINAIVVMEVFMEFDNWLLAQASTNKAYVTLEKIKSLSKYESDFVDHKMVEEDKY